jgi:hypothetical protein
VWQDSKPHFRVSDPARLRERLSESSRKWTQPDQEDQNTLIDMQPIGMVEHLGTEAHQQISQPIEFENRVQHGADAISCPTPVEHPQAPAATIEGYLGGKTQPALFWQLQPAFLDLVGRFRGSNRIDTIHQPRPEERAPKSGLPDFGNQ